MNIGWPEGIVFGLFVLKLLILNCLDGELRMGKHNLATGMLGVSLWFGLLYWGGFFA